MIIVKHLYYSVIRGNSQVLIFIEIMVRYNYEKIADSSADWADECGEIVAPEPDGAEKYCDSGARGGDDAG